MIMWYAADKKKVNHDRLAGEGLPFSFWPGGGGMLERGEKPASGYHIVGSWQCWEDPTEMQQVEEGIYEHTITLGVNRYEAFQILLDADEDRILHPAMPGASSGCAVTGPHDHMACNGLTWMIDGRVIQYGYQRLSDSQPEEGTGTLAIENEVDYVPVSTRDTGNPGDQYKVTLAIAGKYRAVSWKKVYTVADESEMLWEPAVQGSYYISSSSNRWGLDKMTASTEVIGLHTLDVGPLRSNNLEFQIFRNKDWDQCIYPASTGPSQETGDDNEVCGPDNSGSGRTWSIKGKFGDSFKIEFQRTFEKGADTIRVSWRKTS